MVAEHVALEVERAGGQGRARSRSRRPPWPRRGGSRSGRCRRGSRSSPASIVSTAPASSASMNGGMARSKITARPGSSTRQPMMPSVSGHNFSRRAADRREALALGRDHRRRRAVAEQGGGDDRRGVVAVEADRDRAGLDADEQPVAARLGLGQPRRGGEPGHPAGAAEAEDRHAADIGAEAEARRDAGVDAGRGNAGGRDEHDARRSRSGRGPAAASAFVAASSNIASVAAT